ncbi:MAG: hypothetical protein IKZ96_03085 [Bacilli bacterium]|nr:hypothetical protein [Bacilli bacterium]
MSEVLTLVTQIDSDKDLSLEQKKFWANIIVQKTSTSGKQIFVYKDNHDIEVEFEDLKRIHDEDSYRKVLSELPMERAKAATESVQPVEIPKAEAPATPDMLVNTGYTVAMEPVNPETNVEPHVVDTPIVPVTHVPLSTGMKMTKKPTSFNKTKANSQSGFAEVIVLGVVVLVYIAIIVNLIIRLK